MPCKRFTLDEQYITDVTVRRELDLFAGRDNVTGEELIKAIKNAGRCFSISNKDHDEFTRLREQLAAEGFISIERGWWNGDRVLKSFYLNEWFFKKGHKFPCAAAMSVNISCARKYGWKSISSL